MSKPYVIVGAGLAGLFAAKVLKHFGIKNIVIIEKSDDIGGLLQSQTIKNPINDGADYSFDYGTHFVLSTGIPAIDAILSQDINEENYYKYTGSLQEGHFLNNTLCDHSGCANLLSYPNDTKEKITEEIKQQIETEKIKNAPKTLYEAFVNRYGETASNVIYSPAFKKYTGQYPQTLSPIMESSFAPQRLIITDRERSIQLKKDPTWDEHIAYYDCMDSSSNIVKYYPKSSGIGYWPQEMAKNLMKDGVTIKTGTTVTSAETLDKKISEILLSNGEKIECERIIWTLPPFLLGLVSKTSLPSEKPVMRQAKVINFLTDKKPIERPYWITVYDPNIKSFRVTLYENFIQKEESQSAYKITVEALHSGELNEKENIQKEIFEELKTMSILPKEAKILWSQGTNKAEGFPVLTPRLIDTTVQQISILEKEFENVSIIGRRPDEGHGQMAVMTTAYKTIKKIHEN